MLILKINNIETEIVGYLSYHHYQELEKKLSFRPQGYQFSPAYNSFIRDENGKISRRKWDGWKHQCWRNKKRTYFPTGLYSLAIEYFKVNGIEFKNQDERTKPLKSLDLSINDSFKARDYQEKIINTSCERTRGLIEAATGSGKTVIAAGIIQKLGVSPFLFFVTSVDLLEQSKDSLESSLRMNGHDIKVGQIGGGIVDIQEINVLTIQTAVRALGRKWDSSTKFDSEDVDDPTPIEKYRDQIVSLIRNAKGVICDEVQHWRADTCQTVTRELSNAYYIFGMSATPYRDEGDDMLIQACFGRKIGEIKASQLIKAGWLIKPTIKLVHIKQEKSPFKQYQMLYKSQIIDNQYYNGVISNIANGYVKQNRLVLILVTQISHGKLLEQMIHGSQFLSGASPKKKRKETLDKLRSKEISCIISTCIFDEGIDVRPLDTVILAGQGKSKVRAMQRIGRILRPFTDENGIKKTKATAIDFIIHQKYFDKHGFARRKMYASEEEYVIEDIDL
jgi:superfamily II DNA or RNA helicase